MTEQEQIFAYKELRKHGRAFFVDTYEDVDRIIEALEKQIPKKPNLEGDGYSDGEMVYYVWRCPNCDEAYEVDYDNYDYCPNCGQKIDWSEGRQQS